jgi:aryl-alcohol dehydrogenase-like predicted oxidoreductase
MVLPIPGTYSLDHLKENMAAAKIELSSEEMAEIERSAKQG